jgi:hypothetical protein
MPGRKPLETGSNYIGPLQRFHGSCSNVEALAGLYLLHQLQHVFANVTCQQLLTHYRLAFISDTASREEGGLRAEWSRAWLRSYLTFPSSHYDTSHARRVVVGFPSTQNQHSLARFSVASAEAPARKGPRAPFTISHESRNRGNKCEILDNLSRDAPRVGPPQT